MKKFPIVLSLMILSLFVSVNSSYAKDGEDGSSEVEVKEEQKSEDKEEKKEEIRFEKVEKKEIKMEKKEEIKSSIEEIKKREEKIREQAKETREIKNDLIEKKKEVKDDLKEKREEIKDEVKKEMRDDLDSDDASDSARGRMSEVAKQVNILLQTKEDDKGIGKKVREVAMEQVKSQEKIAEKLAKMEEKKVWLKKMVGYDKEAVLGVTEEIDANRLRIQELIKLQEETTDKTEVAQLETAITSLIDQNAALQDTVQEEMQNQGVWGWFRSMFNRS